MYEEVKKIANSLGVRSISFRRPVSEETLISDLRELARRFGRSDVVRRCTRLLKRN